MESIRWRMEFTSTEQKFDLSANRIEKIESEFGLNPFNTVKRTLSVCPDYGFSP